MATEATIPHRVRRPRHGGVVRRALRRELMRLKDHPARIAAIVILAVLLGVAFAVMAARADAGGEDARAYWAAVRIWLDGGDPYHPTGPFLPYVYAPWMLPLFIPWAMLPWDVAWFAWRGAGILLLAWSVRWAYARRPLPTALVLMVLALPIYTNLDTGNINLLLAVALFGAQFGHGRLGGLIWGLATWMKWVPAPLWLILPARARGWGLLILALSGLLSLLMLPLTIIQLQAIFGFGPRPVRADFLVFVWAAVPWWWRLDQPFAFLSLNAWTSAARRLAARTSAWGRAFRVAPGATTILAGERLRLAAVGFLGLVPGTAGPGDSGRRSSTSRPAHHSFDVGD